MAVSHRRHMLRRGTAKMHEALDAMIGAFSSPQAYQTYVLGSARFRLPLEHIIERHAPFELLHGWSPTMIGKDILADLSALGLQNHTGDLVAPHPEKIEDWLGMFYVLEGSSLGAKLLVKRAESLNINQTNGGAHLVAQAGNFSSWNAFLVVVETISELDEARMIDWANATFSFAHQAFETVMENNLADH